MRRRSSAFADTAVTPAPLCGGSAPSGKPRHKRPWYGMRLFLQGMPSLSDKGSRSRPPRFSNYLPDSHIDGQPVPPRQICGKAVRRDFRNSLSCPKLSPHNQNACFPEKEERRLFGGAPFRFEQTPKAKAGVPKANRKRKRAFSRAPPLGGRKHRPFPQKKRPLQGRFVVFVISWRTEERGGLF